MLRPAAVRLPDSVWTHYVHLIPFVRLGWLSVAGEVCVGDLPKPVTVLLGSSELQCPVPASNASGTGDVYLTFTGVAQVEVTTYTGDHE